MQDIIALDAMRAWTRAEQARGASVAFVPTMGFLHEGHLRLVDRARELADRVVLSIFVNPLQFGPGEDFERYPRDLPRDRALAQGRTVDVLFLPERAAMYPAEPVVRVTAGALGETLEGAARPGHFAGVLTVVLKLFEIVQPDVAVFGRKDFQQATLVRRMAASRSPHATPISLPQSAAQRWRCHAVCAPWSRGGAAARRVQRCWCGAAWRP